MNTDGITAEELGTLQVTREDFLAGLKEVEPSATREFFIEKSSSTFASLGGLNEVKRLLDAVVEHSHMRDEIYEQVGLAPPRGILLVGPSGTGKTAMARALSGEKQIPLIAIDGPQLYSKWLGESERALREVFKKARRAAPCILFFDTIDAVAPKFGADQFGTDVYQRILSQLLREIDNLRDVKGVILLAATNRPGADRSGALAKRALRLHTPVRQTRRCRTRGHHAALLPARAAGARCRFRGVCRLGRKASPAPISKACARRRRYWRLRNFRRALATRLSSSCGAIFWRSWNPIVAVPSN